MIFDPIYLLYGAVFIGTLLLVEGVYYLMLDLRGGAQNSINRRMRMRAKASDERARRAGKSLGTQCRQRSLPGSVRSRN